MSTTPRKDPTAPVKVRFTRTHKLSVPKNLNAGKRASIEATNALYREMVAWFADFFVSHGALVDAGNSMAALSACERMTLAVLERKGRDKQYPSRSAMAGWDFTARFGKVPRDLRRAAINAAYGHVDAYLKLVKLWEASRKKGSRKKGTPTFGIPGQHPVMYGQMSQMSGDLYRAGYIRLNLLNPASGKWEWTNIPVAGRPDTLAMLEGSEVEKARRRCVRARITEHCEVSGRLTAKGKPAFTKEERAEMALAVGAVEAASPTLVVTRKGNIALSVGFERSVEVVKAEPGRLAGLHRRVMTVDSNTHNVAAVVRDGDKVLAVRKFSYSDIVDNREKAVGTAIRQQRLSRHRPHGEHQSIRLWEHVSNQGETCARQVASWLTRLAVEHGVTVIVFEYLRPYRPARRKGAKNSRTARQNQKRSYWLRGKIRSYTGERALAEGILTVERNPAWTSHSCPQCHRLGERFSTSTTNPANRSRFRCEHCKWTGDADVVAALNLHAKWTRTFAYPDKAEVKAWRKREAKRTKTLLRGEAAAVANSCEDATVAMLGEGKAA